MVNWGVIGCGGIARRRMIPAAAHFRNSRIAAVMDSVREITETVAREASAKACHSVEAILADPEVQAVYIATPVYLHHDQAIAAAKAGKHVLVEKPLAITLEQGREMVDACRASGVYLAEGYMMKYHALHQKAREMVQAGDIGGVVFARAQLSCWYPDIPGAWRQHPALGGGGALMDMATHLYDLLEYITGSCIVEVSAFTDTLTFKYPVDDSSTTLLRFANGAHGVADAFFNVPDAAGQDRLEVYGNKGSIQGEGTIGQMPGGKLVAYLSDDSAGYDPQQSKESLSVAVREIAAEPVNMYAAELDALSDCIEAGRSPQLNSGEDGLHILAVAQAAYGSSKTGHAMRVTL